MDEISGDPLSDVLKLVRLSGCVYFLSDFAAPWGMKMDNGPFAQFHYVARGQCCLTAFGEDRTLSSGDVVLFLAGDAHALADAPGREGVPGRQVLEAYLEDRPMFREGGDTVSLLCGHFEFDREVSHPLIRDLPRLIYIRDLPGRQPGWFDAVARALVGETRSAEPGAEGIVERLAEILFVQTLRLHVLEQEVEPGFLAAVSDARISRALACIHADLRQRLTLEDIARAAGMSRSALALRFKELLGISPMRYLTTWRMLQARELLKSPRRRSLAGIAEDVGYTSEAALSRAFKREFDESPSAFRRTASGNGSPTAPA